MGNFKWDKKYLYWGVTAFFVIIACIAFFWVIQRWDVIRSAFTSLLHILNPFIIGFALAYLLNPFVKFLQDKLFDPVGMKFFRGNNTKAGKFGRGIAILVSILTLIAVVSALFRLVLPQLYESIESVVVNLQGSLEKLQIWADKWLEDVPVLEQNFSETLSDVGATLTQWVKASLLPQMNEIIASVSFGVISIFKALANIFVAVAVSVYLLYNREVFAAQAKKLLYCIFSVKQVKSIISVFRFTDRSFMRFFSGKLLDSLIIGIICYFGCIIIRIPDAVLISVIIGITNIIPFFGPFIGAIPSAFIVLMYSPLKCLFFIIFIIILQQFDGNVLGPKILGNSTGLSGFWVLFSIIVGAGLLGPIGMIVGVPLFAVIYAGISNLAKVNLKKRGLPSETARYENIDYFDPETMRPVSQHSGQRKKGEYTSTKSRKTKANKAEDIKQSEENHTEKSGTDSKTSSEDR